MSTSFEQRKQAAALLGELSDDELRALCIESLRGWRRERPLETVFSMHGSLGPGVIQRAAERGGQAVSINALAETFLDATNDAWMTGILEFTFWFARAGFAVPLLSGGAQYPYPISFRVTRDGLRFLALTDEHPLLPQSIERLRARCPNLPDDVIALLVDSRTCLERALLRPSVVMMGVAYEVAIEAIAGVLVNRGVVDAAVLDAGAASRITSVRNVLLTLYPGNAMRDRRTAFDQALTFADQLRRRRNDASHTTPRYGFENRSEIEELLVSAGRHLPDLWALTV